MSINYHDGKQWNDVYRRPPLRRPVESDHGNNTFPDWSHLKWYVLGDSLTDPTNNFAEKRYYDYISEKTGIQVIVDGIGGTGYYAGISTGVNFAERIKSIPEDIDIVTIFGSGNDVPWLDSENGEVWNTMAYLANNRVGTRVIIVPPSPWATYDKRQSPWKDYCDRLKTCAHACDFRYASDMYDCPPFSPMFATNIDKFFSTDPNGIHPDDNGHRGIARVIYNAMCQELAFRD